ncbi:MAG: hypothetical protein IJ245_08040 [Lachnospiraceae bacterium]|nr:hypothetical protein [Lachnospiraceae bacterium]
MNDAKLASNTMFMWFQKHLDDEKDVNFWNDARTAMQAAADTAKEAHDFAIRYGLFLLRELEEYERRQNEQGSFSWEVD